MQVQKKGLNHPHLRRELTSKRRIDEAYVSYFDSGPELLGRVKHQDNGHITGLLRR